MSEQQATPRPWRVTPAYQGPLTDKFKSTPFAIGGADGFEPCLILGDGKLNAGTAEANAQLIVTAVNAHDALVKAAQNALTALRYLRDKDTIAWDLSVTPEICNTWDDLRAALALAESVATTPLYPDRPDWTCTHCRTFNHSKSGNLYFSCWKCGKSVKSTEQDSDPSEPGHPDNPRSNYDEVRDRL